MGLVLLIASGGAWAQGKEAEPSAISPVWQAGTACPIPVSQYGFAQAGEDMYVIGGFNNATGTLATMWRYNATTNIWTRRANMPVGSRSAAASHLNGKIYVADGFQGISSTNLMRIYDIATDTWTAGPVRPGVGRSDGAAAGALNGKIYVVGGETTTNTTVSIYNVASNTWSPGPVAPSPFYLGGYAQVGQFLYLIGSYGFAGNHLTVSMRLDMATDTWSIGPVWTPARADFALAAAGTKLFAIGGFAGTSSSAQVDELDTNLWPGGTWISSPDNLPTARVGHRAGFVSTGRIGGEIWSTGGEAANAINEHLFRAVPTCLTYLIGAGAGTIVPGTVDTGNHGDDVSTVVALPFSYRLYDQAFSSVSVGSNGHLTFGTVNNTFDPTCIPVANATYAIGAYWTDQCTGACNGVSGAGLGIFTSITGSAPNRIFNIEWRTAYYNSGGAGVPLNYEVRLYENQPIFDVIYGTVNTFTPPQARKLSTGLQKSDGPGQFTQQGCDLTGGTAPPVSSGFRLRYTLASTTCAPLPAPTGFLYAAIDDTTGNRVYGFSVNETSGALTALSGFPVATGGTGSNSSSSQSLVTDPVNQRLYVINDGANTVSAFTINPTSGALAPMPVSPIPLGTGNWSSLAVHPTGSPLLIDGNGIKSFNLTSNTAVEAAGSPFASNGASSSVFSRDGGFYYEGGAGTSFGGFSVNPGNGVLTALAGSPFNSGGVNPNAYATDSQSRLLGATDSGMTLRAFTTASGIPSAVTGNPFASGLSSLGGSVLHPNERFYFVSAFTAAQFGGYRVEGSGAGTTLAPVAGSPFSSAAGNPLDLVTNQSGAFLFGNHFFTRNISTYQVDPNTGALSNPSVQPADTLGAAGVASSLAYTNALMARTAVSRKTHGGAGVFDVNLPLTGTPGVECRLGSGAGSGDHQIVVAFAAPVTVPVISLVSGTIGGGGFGVNGNVVTITLTGVPNAQTVVLRFDGVTDGVNTGTVDVAIAFLAGDTNASRTVSASDVGQTKGQSGQAVTGTNFRLDVNASGSINASDVGVVKSRSGTGL